MRVRVIVQRVIRCVVLRRILLSGRFRIFAMVRVVCMPVHMNKIQVLVVCQRRDGEACKHSDVELKRVEFHESEKKMTHCYAKIKTG
jgi:hypothetical protein